MTEAALLKVKNPNILFDFIDYEPEKVNFRQEVIEGLSQKPKALAPKFFYDEKGSELFNQITDLSEYYITRTEMKILNENAKEIATCIGKDFCLIELGSANSRKMRALLNHTQPEVYIPVDISKEHLLNSCDQLIEDYPDLEVIAICADYTQDFQLPELRAGVKKVGFFPGSTLGNFDPKEAAQFLQKTAKLLGKGGGLLVGVDLKKDPFTFEMAYNDPLGVTESFNKNVLERINRELNGDFDIDGFSHLAHYNAKKGRVEMHLISNRDQKFHIENHEFSFSLGESIHTENSYKFSVKDFNQVVKNNGFKPTKVWMDDEKAF